MIEKTGPLSGTSAHEALMREMQITEREIAKRKSFLEFAEEDVERLLELNTLARDYADDFIETFYRHFFAFDETREFFMDPTVLVRVKELQKDYFIRLTEGGYDMEYVEHRLNIGLVHATIDLDVKWYLGAYNFYLRNVGNRILKAYPEEPAKAFDAFSSLMKLVFLDIGLAIDTYIAQRERIIRQQQESIRELSTPVLKVRDRLLIMPIIGTIDTLRARQLTEQLLHTIRETRAKAVVMDITGVPAVDSRVANHLVQTVEASRLMGATVIVTGLSAEVAQTLVLLGTDLSKLNTVGDLQGGLDEADRLIGYKAVRINEAPAQISPE